MNRWILAIVLAAFGVGCASASFHPTAASRVDDQDWRIVRAPGERADAGAAAAER